MPSGGRGKIISANSRIKVRFPKQPSKMTTKETDNNSSSNDHVGQQQSSSFDSPSSILDALLSRQSTKPATGTATFQTTAQDFDNDDDDNNNNNNNNNSNARAQYETEDGDDDDGLNDYSTFSTHEELDEMSTLWTTLPLLSDSQPTPTSIKQDATAKTIMRFLDQTPLPALNRSAHINYLLQPLERGLNSRYTTLDASRPWMLYWCLNGLAVLGYDVGVFNDAYEACSLIDTLKPLQSPMGGFGGGNGQWPHLAATYAALLSLTITTFYASKRVPESQHAALYSASFSWIDRKQLLAWLRKLRVSNGGFKVNMEGEEDVRAGYCALIICALMCYDAEELNAGSADGETPFLQGVPEYFKRCQTWEGGIGAKQHAEAHGGYAFCVVAGLCLIDAPKESLHEYLDIEAMISWLSARQYAPEGGFSGRTNKLVDGCYSTWVGGCWSPIEAAVNAKLGDGHNVGSLWSRESLIRYIMTCCQDQDGGLKDKPGMRPDQYHTNYVLLGLSSAQHYYFYQEPEVLSSEKGNAKVNMPFQSAFNWKGSKNVPAASSSDGYGGGWQEGLVMDEDDRVGLQHPLFNIPLGAEKGMWTWWDWWRKNGKPDGILVD